MEGSDLNYYFNWIKSQLSSQVVNIHSFIWYYSSFSSAGDKPQISVLLRHLLSVFFLVCKMCPINCPPPPSSHSTNKHRIGITACSVHSSTFMTSMNERAPCFLFFFAVVYLSLEPTRYRSWNRLRSRNYFPQWSEYESSVLPLLQPPPPRTPKSQGLRRLASVSCL